MPLIKKKSPWVLLSMNDMPSASERANLLGAITLSYENPLGQTCPKNLPKFMKDIQGETSGPTTDESFRTLLSSSKSRDVHVRLAQIATSMFKKNSSDTRWMESMKVQTYLLKGQHSTFKKIKEMRKGELEEIREYSKSGRTPGRLYLVVGVKTCLDATVSHKKDRGTSTETKMSIPTDPGSTGVPPLSLGTGSNTSAQAELDMKLVGERIFAVQYLVVKSVRDWKISGFGRREGRRNSLTLGSEMRVSGSAGLIFGHNSPGDSQNYFGPYGDWDSNGSDDDEDEDEADKDGLKNDELDIRRLEYTSEELQETKDIIIVDWD
jgi:hypothetical protein